jgi:hypothetical protein
LFFLKNFENLFFSGSRNFSAGLFRTRRDKNCMVVKADSLNDSSSKNVSTGTVQLLGSSDSKYSWNTSKTHFTPTDGFFDGENGAENFCSSPIHKVLLNLNYLFI